MDLQSIKSVKHNAAKSVSRSILKKSRHLEFGVFIVHSSMFSIINSLIIVGKKNKQKQYVQRYCPARVDLAKIRLIR